VIVVIVEKVEWILVVEVMIAMNPAGFSGFGLRVGLSFFKQREGGNNELSILQKGYEILCARMRK